MCCHWFANNPVYGWMCTSCCMVECAEIYIVAQCLCVPDLQIIIFMSIYLQCIGHQFLVLMLKISIFLSKYYTDTKFGGRKRARPIVNISIFVFLMEKHKKHREKLNDNSCISLAWQKRISLLKMICKSFLTVWKKSHIFPYQFTTLMHIIILSTLHLQIIELHLTINVGHSWLHSIF